jgi:hypothetical protein
MADHDQVEAGSDVGRLPLVEAELEAALAHARAELAVVRGSLATVVTYLARPS